MLVGAHHFENFTCFGYMVTFLRTIVINTPEWQTRFLPHSPIPRKSLVVTVGDVTRHPLLTTHLSLVTVSNGNDREACQPPSLPFTSTSHCSLSQLLSGIHTQTPSACFLSKCRPALFILLITCLLFLPSPWTSENINEKPKLKLCWIRQILEKTSE